MSFSSSLAEQWLLYFSENPWLKIIQIAVLALSATVIFLVLYVTRDILLRTRSLAYQILCILLVAVLPIAGFLLYLLIRPGRTLHEREMEDQLQELMRAHRHKKGYHRGLYP